MYEISKVEFSLKYLVRKINHIRLCINETMNLYKHQQSIHRAQYNIMRYNRED